MNGLERRDMRFIHEGVQGKKRILLIHGLSASAESCYQEVAGYLQKDYHMILCELDGHYDGSLPFAGIEDACKQIEAYVDEQLQGRIHGLSGLSLGGTIALSLLARGRIQVDKTMIDAAYCVDMGLLKDVYAFLFPLGVARVRDGKKVPGWIIDWTMGKGNRSFLDMIYPGIQVESCRNACRDVYRYRIPEEIRKTGSKVEFWLGSNEYYPMQGAKSLAKYLPDLKIRVFPGMGHCQFLHEHAKEYALLLDRYMKSF